MLFVRSGIYLIIYALKFLQINRQEMRYKKHLQI